MTTATLPGQYRQTRSGEWVVMAAASQLTAGRSTIVVKRDGTTKHEMIERVGRPFVVNGREMAYGYIARSARPAAQSSNRCDCGGWATVTVTDGSGISGKVCRRCAADPMSVSLA